MNKYELHQIGQFHTNYNEDFLISEEIGDHQLLIAVMDGCSSGTDSHFASTLIGKLLRKIAKDFNYKSFVTKQSNSNKFLLKESIGLLFHELKLLNSKLDLRSDELLSTVLIAIVDTSMYSAEILAIGDGLVCIDGKYIEYEQDNKPDYIGYHLTENFETWYEKQLQVLSIESFRDLSLSTDGIHTFKKFDEKRYKEIDDQEIWKYLFEDIKIPFNENMLRKKMIYLEKEFGLKPSDDLTIIRLTQ